MLGRGPCSVIRTETATVVFTDLVGSTELLQQLGLMESGKAFRKGEQLTNRDLESLGIPEGVKEAIGNRLSRLSAETNKFLNIASVIGNEFDLELLERVAEMPEDSILDALDEAKSAALITKAANNIDSYTFAHMLMRATLYDALSPIRRARMHERVGIALEQLTAGTPGQCIVELARHWTAAAKSGDLNKALNYTRQAGDWSLTGLAFEQAAKYYEQALALLSARDCSAEPLRCDLLIALSDAQRRAGDIKYRETIAEAVQIARALGDAKRFALSVLGGARQAHPFANANLVDQSLIDLYEEAIAALQNEDENVLLAKLYFHLAGELLYTPHRERRIELSRRAVVLARRCGDRAVLAQACQLCVRRQRSDNIAGKACSDRRTWHAGRRAWKTRDILGSSMAADGGTARVGQHWRSRTDALSHERPCLEPAPTLL
jgi:hypothetical protein